MNFLHTFNPQPILLDIGFISIRWYGIFMVLALVAGLFTSLKIAKWHGVKSDIIYDLFFWLVIGGFIGARFFYVLYNFNYFWNNPFDVFKIWQGGLAIHGALVAGLIVLWWFAKRLSLRGAIRRLAKSDEAISLKQQHSKNYEIASPTARNDKWFWLLVAIITPGVALGQAIGRWGNYFNQELFGLPTDLAWGIPIALANRPAGFENFTYFHPTFLYESVGSLIICGLLMLGHWLILKKKYLVSSIKYQVLVGGYLLLYSFLRFSIEFLRIDPTAGNIFGMRETQMISAGFIIIILITVLTFKIFLDTKRLRIKS